MTERFVRKHRVMRAVSILLVLILCAQLCAVSSSAAETAPVGVDGQVKIWEWTRADTQATLPSDTDTHMVMLLYKWKGNMYMVDGSQHSSGSDFSFTAVTPGDGINMDSKTFRTKNNVSNMTIQYTGQKDSDNSNAKICKFGILVDGKSKTLALGGSGFFLPSVEKDSSKVTVLTSGWADDEDINIADHYAMLFHNVSMWGDTCVMIDEDNGSVSSETETSWDLGQFEIYIGKEIVLSAVTHDFTIASGEVVNFNDYIYIETGVTITIESGGVLSISGTLYNNGAIMNKGGDIVVQKNATIEPFCLNDAQGGTIHCSGGDLVILNNGRVSTATTASSASYCSGFVLENGSTCTNFGILVVGSRSQVLSGATLDNRSSGRMYFGYRLKKKYSGDLNSLSASELSSAGTYDSSSYYDLKEMTYTRVDLLYVGSNVMLYNDGYFWLDAWADRKFGAANITYGGSGKVRCSEWSTSFKLRYGWSMPNSWASAM